jgi:hypothetical protein
LQKGHYEVTVPVIVDRVLQARVVNALEPEWEARFEPRSYGFRPGRGCHDAIEAIFQVAKGANPARQWVLDADLTAAFDRIDHHRLLDTIGEFPARERIAGWLKAGVVESGFFAATEAGTPQGGVISPLLLNVTLHGMEHAAGARYDRIGPRAAAARRLPIDGTRLRLLHAQHGRCARCGQLLLHADHPPQTPAEWALWLAATRKAITKNSITLRERAPDRSDLRLIHTRCHPRQPGDPPQHHRKCARAGNLTAPWTGRGCSTSLGS